MFMQFCNKGLGTVAMQGVIQNKPAISESLSGSEKRERGRVWGVVWVTVEMHRGK